MTDSKYYDLLITGAIVEFEGSGNMGVVLGNSIACYDGRKGKHDYIFSIMHDTTHTPIRPMFGPDASLGYHIIAIYHITFDRVGEYIEAIFKGKHPVMSPCWLVYDEGREYCKEVTMKDIEEKFGCKVRIVEEDTNEEA